MSRESIIWDVDINCKLILQFFPTSVKELIHIVRHGRNFFGMRCKRQPGLGICSLAQNGSFKRATMSDLLSLLFKKEPREQIALAALYKRGTGSKLLLILFTKERRKQIALVAHYKRAKWVICLWFALLLKKISDSLKKFIFLTRFLLFALCSVALL